MKFLVPFAALVALGRRIGWRPPEAAVPGPIAAPAAAWIETVGQPFSRGDLHAATTVVSDRAAEAVAIPVPALAAAVWLCGMVALLALWLVRCRQVAAVIDAAAPIDDPRVLGALRRVRARLGTRDTLRAVTTGTRMEPGVFGIARPVLLWPRGIAARLSDDQIEAIVAHEWCHVVRRDNLAAALHAAVQAVFWFHPVVWWIGRRLVDERERACDEAVLALGSEPRSYAEGILTTCRFFAEAPSCVSGVTGSDLVKRIEDIMTNDTAARLTPARKLMLGAAAAAAVGVPLVVGWATAPPIAAQSAVIVQSSPQPQPAPPAAGEPPPAFEVASVKPNRSGAGQVRIGLPANGRLTLTNVTLREAIRFAYQVMPFQITGGPDWVESDRFDITAKIEEGAGPPNAARTWLALRALLTERFNLAVRQESRDMPTYALVVARSDGRLGEKLRASGPDCAPLALPAGRQPAPPPPPPSPAGGAARGLPIGAPQCPTMMGPGFISSRRTTMTELSRSLSILVRRVVVDKTGLTGVYDADVEFSSEFRPPSPPGAPAAPDLPADGASIFTALQEQLGLKLESERGPVDVIVIDRADALIPD
jgi:uncharacterized protein (TIGR03435 family)